MPSTADALFAKAHEVGASDVHIVVDTPVMFRIDGQLLPQTKAPLGASQVELFVKALLGADLLKVFREQREVDMSYQLKGGVRLRVNCHFERGSMGLAARIVPTKIPSLNDVGLEEVGTDLCAVMEGLILFTGPTGSGKSTSLAAMIQHINNDRPANIITLEDPIEFLFPVGKGIVRQRQYREDFLSFPEALKRVLRQDPNVIMVGEMRDLETIAATLTLAETGHLIFATLHTPNAAQAVDRIVDVFPPHQQNQVRSQLSLSLRAVIAQRLLPRKGGGRVALREILINTPAAANIIRSGRAQELPAVLQTGKAKGMCTFEQDAKRLYKEGLIAKEVLELCGG